MTDPLVSILLPTYNAGPYLQTAVDSILDQDYGRLELLVLDDGSTDDSVDLLKIDDRVRVVRKLNTGLADTLNVGIETAHGNLIARMDADDIAASDRITRQVAAYETHDDLVLLGTQIRRFTDEHIISTSRFPTDHDSILRALAKGEHAMCHPSIMMRTDVARAAGGYWEHGVAEDWDLFLRLSEVGAVGNLAECLLDYRFHGSSINSLGMRTVRRNILLATTNYRRRAEHLPELTPDTLEGTLSAQERFLLRRESAALAQYRRGLLSSGWKKTTHMLAAALLWPEQVARRLRGRFRRDTSGG